MNSLKPLFLMAYLLICFSSSVHASEKIVLVVSGIKKQIYLPARIAEQLGYFKEQGLNVSLVSESSGVNSEDMMLSGAAHGVIGAYDHTIALQSKGKSVQSIVLFTIAPGESVIVSKKINSNTISEVLSRYKVGVTGLGSSTNLIIQYLAHKNSINPKNLSIIPVGSDEKFISAINNDVINAGITTEPTASKLLATGNYQILIDLRTPEASIKELGGLYPFSCLYLPTSWISSHRDESQKLANAFVKSLQFINTHSASEIAKILPTEDLAGNQSIYIQSLAKSKSIFIPDGVMPTRGPVNVFDAIASTNKQIKSKKIDLNLTYTNEFVTKVK